MRPYRYIGTTDLQAKAGRLADEIVYNALHGWTTLSGPAKRELRRINRELYRRAKLNARKPLETKDWL